MKKQRLTRECNGLEGNILVGIEKTVGGIRDNLHSTERVLSELQRQVDQQDMATFRKSCPECRTVFPEQILKGNRALANMAELFQNGKEKERRSHCEQHQEELKLFCETDKKLICSICRDAQEHKFHNFLPIDEAAEMYREKLKPSLESAARRKNSVLDTKVKQTQIISAVKEELSSLQTHITYEFAKMHQILTEREQRLIRDLREQEELTLEPMEKNLSGIQQELDYIEGELSKLQAGIAEQDALTFLKDVICRKRRVSEEVNTLSLVQKCLPLGIFKGPLQYITWRRMIDLISTAPASLTLDPNTAHPQLSLSEDLTCVKLGDKWKPLPDNPERFTRGVSVLGSEGFPSGRHYWEVEVGDKTEWSLGVAQASINRKESLIASPELGYWIVMLKNMNDYRAASVPSTLLHITAKPRRIRVYLDYEGGQVSFYNADNMSHLYTYTVTFKQKLYPFFSPGFHDGKRNLEPLRICGVTGV